jgi:hypothetical protein
MRQAWRSERPYFSRMRLTAWRSRSRPISRGHILKDLRLEGEIGHEPAQTCILPLKILQAPSLLDLQAAILLAPAIVTLLGNTNLLAGELHLDLAQLRDDLLRTEPLFWHGWLLGSRSILSINLVQFDRVRSG